MLTPEEKKERKEAQMAQARNRRAIEIHKKLKPQAAPQQIKIHPDTFNLIKRQTEKFADQPEERKNFIASLHGIPVIVDDSIPEDHAKIQNEKGEWITIDLTKKSKKSK